MWCRVLVSAGIIVVVTGLFGCSALRKPAQDEAPAQAVSLAEVPPAARATIERLTAGGQIRELEKAQEDGRTVYDVEATVGGRDVEYDVAADGTVLTSEQSVPYATVPPAVRAASEKYFGSAEGLAASVEIEGDKAFYEVSGRKGGQPMTLKLTVAGEIIEEENE